METLIKDLRYGVRSLLKQPAFALISIATLALAIGGNTAMFTVVNTALLRPLQYPESDRVALIEGVNPPRGITQSAMSVPDFVDWQNQNQVFEKMAGFFPGGFIISNGDETERVRGALVTADFFNVLRLQALRGRLLQPDDTQPGKGDVAVIGYGLWQRRFGGDRNVVGRPATIGGKSITIVGVLSQGLDYPQQSEGLAVSSVPRAIATGSLLITTIGDCHDCLPGRYRSRY